VVLSEKQIIPNVLRIEFFEQHYLIDLFIIYLKILFDIAINSSNEEK
jgi:hypothetical protein